MFSSYDCDGLSKVVFVQRCQDSCLVARDTSGFYSMLDRAIGMPRGDAEDPGSLSRCHWHVRIPINFQEESGIVSF